MRLILLLAALLIVAGSFYADYRWKRWIARQRDERERSGDEFRHEALGPHTVDPYLILSAPTLESS